MLSPPPMPLGTAANAELAAKRQRLAAMEVEINLEQQGLNDTQRFTAGNPSAAEAWNANSKKLNRKKAERDRLKAEIEAARDRKGDDAREAMRKLVHAAVEGRDAEARERVRSLLPMVVQRILPDGEGGFEI